MSKTIDTISKKTVDMSEKTGNMSEKVGYTSEKAGYTSEKAGYTSEKMGNLSEKAGNTRNKAGIKNTIKSFAFLLGIFSIMFIFCGCFEDGITVGEEYELIRIHIRANSDSETDQAVKLKVRDAVTEYLSKELAKVESREEAYAGIESRQKAIKAISDRVLVDNGFSYNSKLILTNEFFPTRQYENITVESGYYDALIIELGEGSGTNWWCVIYPPLCYLEADYGTGFRYKSKLKELIDKYFN